MIFHANDKKIKKINTICLFHYIFYVMFTKKYFVSQIFFTGLPIFGQLIKKARENNINVIFIIGGVNSTNTKQAYYDGLAKQFPGGTRNAFSFSFDSNGLLSTILDSYRVNGDKYYLS